MIEVVRRSPARVSARAAAPLPRWALVGMLLAFIVPGQFGRDLWPPDAAEFGRMWTMSQGSLSDWLLPNVAGSVAPHAGPLSAWLGALLIVALGRFVGDVNAAAASNLVWYPLIVAALWLAVYRLARRDEAQPVAGAFGGEATRQPYARLLADVSVLLTIGTLGVIWRLHQTRVDSASLACVSAAMLAASLLEWRLTWALSLGAVSIGGLALAQGPVPALGLALGLLAVLWRAGAGLDLSAARRLAGSAALLGGACLLASAWPLAAFRYCPQQAGGYFLDWLSSIPFGRPSLSDAAWVLRDGSWFFWPLWPLALWAVYAWRASLAAAHMERPLLVLAGLALAASVSVPLDDELATVGLLPPLAALAAYGAITLRRALDNVIDWLAIMLFSLLLLTLWAYFAAGEFGVPRAMANSLHRLTPGFADRLHPLSIVLAAVATVAWLQLIFWRVARRPPVLWRGPLLAAAGVTAVWICATLLYLPAADYIYSYRRFAIEMAGHLHARGLGTGCVWAPRLPLAERAMLAYYGKIRFDDPGSSESCRFALHHDTRRDSLDEGLPPGLSGTWTLAWEGQRRARPDERWRIWTRNP